MRRRAAATLLAWISCVAAGDEVVLVDGARIARMTATGKGWEPMAASIELAKESGLTSAERIGAGDFVIRAKLILPKLASTGARLRIGESALHLDGRNASIVTVGPLFGGAETLLGPASKEIQPATAFDVEVKREGTKLSITVGGDALATRDVTADAVGTFGIESGAGTLRIQRLTITANLRGPRDDVAADVAKLQPAIDTAIDRGVAWLLSVQHRDGSWSHDAPMFLGGQTALCLYTLLKAGLPVAHPSIQRALAYLDGVKPGETYSAATALMAYEALHDPNYLPKMRAILEDLLSWRVVGKYSYPHERDGRGWVTAPGVPDLSNLQFAVLGMRAAAKAGLPIAPEIWREVMRAGRLYQEKERLVDVAPDPKRTSTGKVGAAGFGYRDSKPYGSMTCAGICVLKICADGIGKQMPAAERRDVDAAIERGVNWLAANFSATSNPKSGGWVYYYLYGLERVGALVGTEFIGDRPWYLEGARHLLESAGKAHGEWGNEPDTCFAILFLKRATQQVVTGDDAGRSRGELSAESPAFDVSLRGAGQFPMTVWITGFGETARATHGGGSEVAGLRVARVEYLVDGDVAATAPGNPRKGWSGELYKTSFSFAAAGKHRVGARVHLVAASAPKDEIAPTVVLEAPGFQVDVAQVLEPWMLEVARSRPRNLLIGRVSGASATSELPSEGPAAAVDGLESTRWVSKPTDRTPMLTIELSSPVKANAIVFTSGGSNPQRAKRYDRITRVELRVNADAKPTAFDVEPDERTPKVLLLPKAIPIQRIEIRIVGHEAQGDWKGNVSIAELALEERKEAGAAK